MKKILLLFSIAFLMAFSSCLSLYSTPRSLYKEPHKSESIAIVKSCHEKANKRKSFEKNDNIWILNVSSSSTIIPENISHGVAYEYAVLPGIYTFQIESFNTLATWEELTKSFYYNNISLGVYQVTFSAEAGKTYVICSDADHEKREVDIYVKDEKSGERVESTVVEIERYKLKSKE